MRSSELATLTGECADVAVLRTARTPAAASTIRLGIPLISGMRRSRLSGSSNAPRNTASASREINELLHLYGGGPDDCDAARRLAQKKIAELDEKSPRSAMHAGLIDRIRFHLCTTAS